MDRRGFSVEIGEAVKESITVAQHRNGRTYKYELVALFARVWFLKAQILGRTVTEEFISGLRSGSRFLLTSFTPKFKEMLMLVEQVPLQVESQNGKKSMVRDYLHKFLAQAMLFQAEALLSELWLKHETLRGRIGALQEGIIFLIKSDVNLQRKKEDSDDEKLVLADFEQLATGVISVCRSSSSEPGVGDMESQLSGLLEEVESLKSKLRKLYFQRPDSSFPKTPGIVPVELLLERLKGMRIQKHDALACAAYQIEVICTDLELCLKCPTLKDSDTRRGQLVEAAYQVDHIIDSMRGTKYSESLLLMWLYDQSLLIKDLLRIAPPIHKQSIICRDATMAFNDETSPTAGFQEEKADMIHRLTNTTDFNDETSPTVGFQEEKADMIHRLTTGSMGLEVVSIIGMGGVGKSTLARDVFLSPAIVRHFGTQTWCTVSQVYTENTLLREILNQVTGVSIDVLAVIETSDLKSKLYESLKGKRYLIVMDDVWSREVVSDLQRLFPDDLLQSRILITSRDAEVAPNNPYCLRLLSEEESCELLRLRIFGRKGWPSIETLEVAMQISQHCRGLPLFIVLVAGILSKAEEHTWPEIANQLIDNKSSDQPYKKVLDFTYSYLPSNLNECYLYFGLYPEDKDISVRRLKWLWIAEGFVHKVDSRSLEDLAEEYLMNLVNRSMVMITKLGSNGKVKKCRVHNLLLELCLLKAKEANFSQFISTKPFNGDSHSSGASNRAQHRVTIIGDVDTFIASEPSGTYVRSLLHFGTDGMFPGCHTDMLYISENFELLKVMNLESINVGYTLENHIGLPVNLRYLAVGGDMTSLPPSLSELEYLQTLIVKGLMNKFVLPSTIWSMKSLRHIDVSNHCLFTLQDGGDGTLDSLVSLSMPSFSYVKETDNILERFPNLQKLKCILLEPCIGSMQIGQFPTFGSLLHLESLKLRYHGWPLISTVDWNFPCTLRELSLSNFRLPWDQISTISKLPNLEVLKLMSNAFEGTTWTIKTGDFENLRYLKLDSLNIVEWNADEEIPPILEHLVLRNCKQLEEVHPGFVEIATLQRIDVHQCGASVEESVRRVVQTQLDYGNEISVSINS